MSKIMKNRLFAFIMALVMVCSLLPMSVFAAEGEPGEPKVETVCTVDANCTLTEGHTEGCPKIVPVCTVDVNCTLTEGHSEGCPKIVPVCTVDVNCTLTEGHSEGCPKIVPVCDKSAECKAETHEEGCLKVKAGEPSATAEGDEAVCNCTVKCTAETAAASGCEVCAAESADLATCTGADADKVWYEKATGDAYTITNEAELIYFAKLVNDGTTFAGKTVTLADNIALTAAWPGIGIYNKSSVGTAFQGTFDGNSKTISNVTFANNGAGEANNYRGFFNQIYNATVKNLTVDGKGFESGVSGEYGGAMIAGHAISSTIQGCVSKGTMSGTHNVAGIVVRINNSNIISCTNYATLTGSYSKLGGIVNISQYSTCAVGKPSLIQGCINEGTITSTAKGNDGVGGIVAYVGYGDDSANPETKTTIKDCQNKGLVQKSEGNTTAQCGQIIGTVFTYLVVEGTNKGLATMHASGVPLNGFDLGEVQADGTVIYVLGKDVKAGNTYLVTGRNGKDQHGDPINIKPVITLKAGESITFNQTLTEIEDFTGITAESTDDIMVQEDATNEKVVTYTIASAKIGDVRYATVAEALAAASENDTVTLVYNITTPIEINKNITLDLNGMTVAEMTVKPGAALSLSGTGTITALKVEEGFDSVTKAEGVAAAKPTGYDWKDNKLTKTWDVTFVEEGKDNVVKTVFTGETVGTVPTITDKTGHTAKWFVGEAEFNQNAAITADTTVTAKWTANQYTITFMNGEAEYAKITQDYGTEVTKPAAPIKEGYKFTGWDVEVPATMPAKNMTLTAQWGIEKYTITFMNGETEYHKITEDYGTAVRAPEAPTKEGYTFAGWNPELPEKMPAGGMTTTAQWEALEYNITYILADGETNDASNPAKYTIATETITLAAPTKTGYTFDGWYNGDTKVTEITKGSTGDITLTAKWTIGTYTITFNTDGGSAVDPITQEYNTDVTAPTAPTKEGYTFKGWNPELPEKMPAGGMTTTAQWEPLKFTVTWKNGETTVETDENVAYGTTPKFDGEEPTKDGYAFKGWNTAADGTGTALTAETKVTAAVTYYAQFAAVSVTAPSKPSAKPDTNAADLSKVDVKGMDQVLESEVQKELNGENGGTVTDVKVQLVVEYASNHADAAKLPESVRSNGELMEISIMKSVNNETAAPVKEIGAVLEIKVPYDFTDNYTVEVYRVHNGEAQKFESLGAKPDSGFRDRTFYADKTNKCIWIYTSKFSLYAISDAPNTYTITYMNGDSELKQDDGTPFTYTYGEGKKLITLNVMGFDFLGWFDNEELTGTAVKEIGANEFGNKTFYAKWDAHEWKVTFDANGGKTPSTTEKMVTYGDKYGTLPTTTKDGLYFAGWYTAKEGGNRVYDTTKVTTDSAHTLYAHWSTNPVTGDALSMAQVAALGGALVLSLAALTAIVVYKKRKEN